MSFQWIRQLNRAFQIFIVLAFIFTDAVQAKDLASYIDKEPDKTTEDYRKFLDEEYLEFHFQPKYHNGRICRAGFDRMGFYDYEKVRDVRDVLLYTPTKVRVSMIGDKCEFIDSNIRVSGRAKLGIEAQETLLTADEITFEEIDKIVDAKGGARVYRDEVVYVSPHFRFKLRDPRYLIQTPRSRLFDVSAKARGDRNWKTSANEKASRDREKFQIWNQTQPAQELRLEVEKRIRTFFDVTDTSLVKPDTKVLCTLNCDGSVTDMRCMDGFVKKLDLVAAAIVKNASPFPSLDIYSPLRVNMEVTFFSKSKDQEAVAVKFSKYWKVVYLRED